VSEVYNILAWRLRRATSVYYIGMEALEAISVSYIIMEAPESHKCIQYRLGGSRDHKYNILALA